MCACSLYRPQAPLWFFSFLK
jgi:hypothetical protein